MEAMANTGAIYTDVQGLNNLRVQAQAHNKGSVSEVAKQFEAILLQSAMKSMRDANKVFESDLIPSNDGAIYQELYDKQLALNLSRTGIGLSSAVKDQIEKMQPQFTQAATAENPSIKQQQVAFQQRKPDASNSFISQKGAEFISTMNKQLQNVSEVKQTFVNGIIEEAKRIAAQIGVDPKVLIAQAALETNWGQSLANSKEGVTSHNFFGIKAGKSGDKVSALTTEYYDGKPSKEVADFRSYQSVTDSFSDYAKLITSNPRYKTALQNAGDSEAYTSALQKAGYATDPDYANKIMKITKDPVFNAI